MYGEFRVMLLCLSITSDNVVRIGRCTYSIRWFGLAHALWRNSRSSSISRLLTRMGSSCFRSGSIFVNASHNMHTYDCVCYVRELMMVYVHRSKSFAKRWRSPTWSPGCKQLVAGHTFCWCAPDVQFCCSFYHPQCNFHGPCLDRLNPMPARCQDIFSNCCMRSPLSRSSCRWDHVRQTRREVHVRS